MEITGCIMVSENELHRFDNYKDNGVSMIMKDTDEPLEMDEDGSMYIEDNPKIVGLFISRNNIPLLQKVLELIDEYEETCETQDITSPFIVGDIEAEFIPDKEFLELASMNPCNNTLPIINTEGDNKEEV